MQNFDQNKSALQVYAFPSWPLACINQQHRDGTRDAPLRMILSMAKNYSPRKKRAIAVAN
jgi:hypothetical protein